MTISGVQLIVSIATSGVVSAIVTHFLSTGRAEREFRRKKLEELFMAVHTYCTKLFSANMRWTPIFRPQVSFDFCGFAVDINGGFTGFRFAVFD
jgi:hypothetical protein